MTRTGAVVAFGVTAAVIGVVALWSSGSQMASTDRYAATVAPTRPRGVLLVETDAGSRKIPARLRSQWASLPPRLARANVAAWAHAHLALVDTSHVWARTSVSPQEVAAILASVRSRTAAVRIRLDVSVVRMRLPAIRQAYRNDCEATALSLSLIHI